MEARKVYLFIWLAGLRSTSTISKIAIDLNKLDVEQKQTIVLQLVDHITELSYFEEIRNFSNSFEIENYLEKFSKIDTIKTFISMKRKGMLRRGEVFCLFCGKQAEQAINVFNVLYEAKDFSTFILSSSWMRQNINEMIFVYVFSIAVRHRSDCNGIALPPIYETYPYLFVSPKVQHAIFKTTMSSTKLGELVLDNDYEMYNYNENSKFSYFTDDTGLNSFYYNFHLDYPFWMTDDVYGLNLDRRGELYIYLHKQLLSRYNLERLSHELCEIRPLNPTQIIERDYDVTVMFHNEWTIPARNVRFNLFRDKYDLVKDLDFLEFQIREAAYKGRLQNVDGSKMEIKEVLEVLGRRIYGNIRKSNDNLKQDIVYITRQLFSSSSETVYGNEIPTSGLQYYEIALRDPIFWETQKYFMILLDRVVTKKTVHRRDDLYFYGVEITKLSVSPLVTFMGVKTVDISNINGGLINKNGSKVNIYSTVSQLDHDAFDITIDVYSNKRAEGVVRVFLGHAVDCHGETVNMEDNFDNFLEIDAFLHTFKDGNNTITRRSDLFNNIYQQQSSNNFETFKYDKSTPKLNVTDLHNRFIGFPQNLLLPRGTRYGIKVNIFVIVSSLDQKRFWGNEVEQFRRNRLCRYTLCMDDKPLGFPFDSKWESGVLYPNMKLVNVFVTHKKTPRN